MLHDAVLSVLDTSVPGTTESSVTEPLPPVGVTLTVTVSLPVPPGPVQVRVKVVVCVIVG